MHCKSLWIKASAKCINVNVEQRATGCANYNAIVPPGIYFPHSIYGDCLKIEASKRAHPEFEPGTSRTLSENHTPRPTSHWTLLNGSRLVMYFIIIDGSVSVNLNLNTQTSCLCGWQVLKQLLDLVLSQVLSVLAVPEA